MRRVGPPERPPERPPSDRPPGQRRPDPEELLGERFARGEIDADEYRQRLQVLRGALREGGGRR